MSRLWSPPLLAALLSGCVMNRQGQSASEQYRRDLALQGQRVTSLEQQTDVLDQRTDQMEELTRARGQEDILKMETLEQVRSEVAKMRGDVDVLRHDYEQASGGSKTREEDVEFRLAWLESRAEQMEKSLGLKPTPPPSRGSGTASAAGAPAEGDGRPVIASQGNPEAPATELTDPDALIKLAEEHLAAGRDKAAEAVLDRFLKLHPNHAKVPEVLYRRAEASFNGKNFAQAVLRFQEVIDRYKSSPWAPYAMLRQGECFEAQGQKEDARLFYEDVVKLFPKSKAAKEAKAKLGR
jgi:tol-pal system protein YbgF